VVEDEQMHKTKNLMTSLFLAAALVAPVATFAAAPQERVYDREHKDYHHWDDHENAAWHRFLAENHRDEHEFAKAKRQEQAEYWNWRHSHPD
jgi:hypothetical protein